MVRTLGGVVAFAVLGAACASSDVVLADFSCGGLTGATCPPQSDCHGPCAGYDCAAPCVADVPCGSDAACLAGYSCDSKSRVCVPRRSCRRSSECAPDEWCNPALGTRRGICVPTASLLQAPPSPCTWPFVEVSGVCSVACQTQAAPDGGTSSLCPGTLACTDGACR